MTLLQKLRHALALKRILVLYLGLILLGGTFLVFKGGGRTLFFLPLLVVWGLLPFALRRIPMLYATSLLCCGIQLYFFKDYLYRFDARFIQSLTAGLLGMAPDHFVVTGLGMLVVLACAAGTHLPLQFFWGKSAEKTPLVLSYAELLAYPPVRRITIALAGLTIGVTLVFSFYCLGQIRWTL